MTQEEANLVLAAAQELRGLAQRDRQAPVAIIMRRTAEWMEGVVANAAPAALPVREQMVKLAREFMADVVRAKGQH